MVALLGALSIAAGVLAIAYPDITLLVLGLIVGINLVLIGAVWVALATMEQHTEGGSKRSLGLHCAGTDDRHLLPFHFGGDQL